MIGASLQHQGEELLGQRNGLPAYEARGSTMGIPLLHPWANRLGGLRYEAAGRHVAIDPDSPLVRLDPNGLPIHGVLAANPGWRGESHGRGSRTARLDFGAQPELLEVFPFPHEIELQIALDDTGADDRDDGHGGADSPVPVSFGFHPYLALPGTPREQWHVELPAREHLVADEHGHPDRRPEPRRRPTGRSATRPSTTATAASPLPVRARDAPPGRGQFARGYEFAQVYAPAGQTPDLLRADDGATNALVAGGPGLRILAPARSHAALQIAVNPA